MSEAAKPPKSFKSNQCSVNAVKLRPVGSPSLRAEPSQVGPDSGPSVGGVRNRSSCCCYNTVISFTAVRGLKMLICDFLQVNPDAIWQPRSTIILPQFSFQLLLEPPTAPARSKEARQARKAHLCPGPDRSANSSAPQHRGGCFSFTDQRSGFSLRR